MYNYKIDLIRIIDGDTIDCYIDLGFNVKIKKRIRLAGIDTPESRTRDLREKEYGLEAKRRLTELLEGASIELQSHEEGKFGRVIGTLYINDKSVNDMLVEEGYAIKYNGGKKPDAAILISQLNEIRNARSS